MNTLQQRARDILEKNDRGGYTLPSQHLYPLQWNWDSAINALGWAVIDEKRAWQEITMLLRGQWDGEMQPGMLPHIVFHQPSDEYFPGADYWGVERQPPTSSIFQPPILADCCLQLYAMAKDKSLAVRMLREIYSRLSAYHTWWLRDRIPAAQGIDGLPLSLHPWESGMDNSPAWDEALARVPMEKDAFTRRDLKQVISAQRPHDKEYQHYLYLVRFFRQYRFDAQEMLKSPYLIHDICILSLLYKSIVALGEIARILDIDKDADATRKTLMNLHKGIQSLWGGDAFYHYDVHGGRLIRICTCASFLPLYAGIATDAQARHLHAVILRWLAHCNYGLPSFNPQDTLFESQRYWRGPSWLHINWLIARGLQLYGYQQTAKDLRNLSLKLIERSGFAEYYDSLSGAPCGGENFSWPAAICLF